VGRSHPLNTIAPYFTMYPLDFPLSVLEDSSADDVVLDPFCGRGTTNFASRMMGLATVGADASPVAHAIAAAKLVATTADDIAELCARALRTAPAGQVPKGDFWRVAYHPRTLADLCAVREYLLNCTDDAAVALRAILLGALHGPRGKHVRSYLSNQMPRTYATKPAGAVRFWRDRGLTPEYVSLLDVVQRRAERAYSLVPAQVCGCAVLCDSRTEDFPLDWGRFTRVVTSPPYYGMRTYVSDQWLRNWFLGGPAQPDYEADRQMRQTDHEVFASDLARVWDNVARHCRDGARLDVRFGAVPSAPVEPEVLLRRSIKLSSAPWRVGSVRPAGTARCGRRQADQFGFASAGPLQEIDLCATLEA
jgi:hypothetical protein